MYKMISRAFLLFFFGSSTLALETGRITPFYLLKSEFDELSSASNQPLPQFDTFDPKNYELASLTCDSNVYQKHLRRYQYALVTMMSEFYPFIFEGLAYMEFITVADKATDDNKFPSTNQIEIFEKRYSKMASKKVFAKALAQQINRLPSFVKTYRYIQKLLLKPLKTILSAFSIEYDRKNQYFDITADDAIAFYCYYRPQHLPLNRYNLLSILLEPENNETEVQKKLNAALLKFSLTGISPDMAKTKLDTIHAVEIFKKYLSIMPIKSIDCQTFPSYIAYSYTVTQNYQDLGVICRHIDAKDRTEILQFCILWFFYHLLQKETGDIYKEEAFYFLKLEKSSFLSDVSTRLIYQLSQLDHMNETQKTVIYKTICRLLEEPTLLEIITKYITLTKKDHKELQQILALHSR